jgi:putative transposase
MRRQCALLKVNRSGLTYERVGPDAYDLELMRRIDEMYLEWPFYGSRRMTRALRKEGHDVNRKRIQRLMRLMGLEGLAPGPNTSQPRKEAPKYPYLLRGVKIERPNQAWATDITYIPMRHGFSYLVAVIDWYSRKVLSWRLSNTLDTEFCLEALDEAIERWGLPEIFNSDQGAQFTADDFIDRLKVQGIAISHDGKGRCLDNVFVERLWRSLKYEDIYLKAYETIREARDGIRRYFAFFNEERGHQSLGYMTPDAVYAGQAFSEKAA